jgi:Domain of unknown function (DUF4157)
MCHDILSASQSLQPDLFGRLGQIVCGPSCRRVPSASLRVRRRALRSGYAARSVWREDFDASVERWTNKDLVRFAGGANLYAYANGDRISTTDPSGLDPLPVYARQELAPFFPGFDLNRIDVQFGIPFIITALSPISPAAVTLGDTVYVAEGAYSPETPEGLALLAHEITHSVQYDQLGLAGFLWRYSGAYESGKGNGLTGDAAYSNIYLEVLARLKAQEVASGCN